MSGIDKAFDEFMKLVGDRAAQNEAHSARESRIVREKNDILQPVRLLLKRFVDLGLEVHHADRPNNPSTSITNTPQPFDVYENQSSPLWMPGISLFLDHPARLEIAVPNDRDKEGMVVIRCSSIHPEAHLLERKFASVDDACLALSTFLSKSTVKINRALPR